MNNALETRVNKGKIVVTEIKVSDFQKAGTKTAQLRQSVETVSTYQGKQANNSLTNSIFSNEDFGFEPQDFSSKSERVCFINVPVNATMESVQKAIDEHKNATIYRIIRNKPILTSSQRYAINRGLRTLDSFANKQVVRYGKGSANEGQLILDQNGKVQYRVLAFDKDGHEDIDERTPEFEDMYLTPEIAEEMGMSDDIADGTLEVHTSVDSLGQNA